MLNRTSIQIWVRVIGGLVVLAGGVAVALAPLIGESVSATLWGVEPLAYVGALLLLAGLGAISLSYAIPHLMNRGICQDGSGPQSLGQWSQLTQHYFDLFDHDLGRPLRRILGKERELRAVLESSDTEIDPAIKEVLDEIESQVPNFRLMMSNIQVLVQLEAPGAPPELQPVEPSEVVRRIVDRYASVAMESHKEISWWAEPSEFGIVYSDSSAIEHIVANLVDNAVRFATQHVETRLTKNPTHFLIRVWDDGSGIASQYMQHVFDRGWTPELARREEKSSSGLGLFIARTFALRYGGDLTVESVVSAESDSHTAFLLSLPLGGPA